MDEYICCIKYVMPKRNAAYINEIDHASVNQTVEHVAKAATSDKTKADIFVALQ